MAEKKFDDMLQIRTIGLREWRGKESDDYSRYEATPYEALEKLFQSYKLKPTDSVVDFGSGRGRVSFYIHYHYNVPVTGIENNDLTFEEALKNEAVYSRHNKDLTAPILFEYGLAENYEIRPEDTVFYFFNPFSLSIFKQVIHNILASLKEEKREMDLILYYPLPEFKQFLKEETPFRLMNKIKAYSGHGKYGKFAVYRYDKIAEG